MTNLGRFSTRTCSGATRRSFLQSGGALSLALGLTSGATASNAVPAKARSVIFIWLWGAPSHIDTFDPKPQAPDNVRGPFAAIATRTPELRFSELLPQLATRSDRFNVIRSHVTFAPGHPDAGNFGLTGFAESPAPVEPSFGAIVGRHRALDGNLAPYTMIGRGVPRDVVRIVNGYGGGRWGKSHDPLLIACNDIGQVQIPSLKLLDDLSPHRIQDRRRLLSSLDDARRELDHSKVSQWHGIQQRAFDLLTDPAAREALDLTRETPQTRAAYGQTSFGQSCLLARRLVEAEVPFIQVNWSEYVEAMTPSTDFGWDTHIYNFELLPDRHCPIFDRAMSTLLDDLQQRGLLDSTLVVAMGEFGRTPRITQRAARDHWPRCYSSLWAGAGMTPGRVIGESDRLGEDPVTTPITPLMVGTTIAEFAGLTAQTRTELNVLSGGTPIHELFE